MINKETVANLAKLARIEVTENEREQLEKDLHKIIDYVEDLRKVPTDGLPEVAQVTGLTNVLREDTEVCDVCSEQVSDALLKCAPETENGYIKVKAIFE